jgi:hypothetical protein
LAAPDLTLQQTGAGWIIKLRGDWVLANLPLSSSFDLPELDREIKLDGSEIGRAHV